MSFAAPPSRTFAKVSPLVSSSACKVVAAEERTVMTCSRFGLPRQTVSASALAKAARTFPRNSSPAKTPANARCAFHGGALASPSSAACCQSWSEKDAVSHPFGFSRDQSQELSLPKLLLLPLTFRRA